MRGPDRPSAIRPLAVAVGAIAVAVVAALVVLWPSGDRPRLAEGLASPTERAEVLTVTEASCPAPQPGECTLADVRLGSGPDEGATVQLILGSVETAPDLAAGDSIRVTPGSTPSGALPAGGPSAYSFADFERGAPLLWLALAFAALVVVFARLRGFLSLVGLGASLVVIVAFVIPAILDGKEPLAVAIAGALAVMLITISLAHGLGPKSLAAIAGTTTSLLLVAALALAFTEAAHLTGLAGEAPTLLQVSEAEISFEGLLLAGMVIAALGVLDDVTVSQAATVLALRRANPSLGFRDLYGRALDVGRDHVSATVNTLVLAYVGASLPILLLFGSGELGFGDAVRTEVVAQEVVATLVGSIGLIAAVPITTALTAMLVPASALGDAGDEHGHHH